MLAGLPPAVFARRLPRMVVGLVLFGVGLAFLVAGDFGLPPWDVLHQGIAEKSPLSIGVASIGVSVAVAIVVLAFREPLTLGTVLNIVVIGLTLDGVLVLLETPSSLGLRVLLTLAGPPLVALGSGLYLGVCLGPGPRDGLMTALVRRGVPAWAARWGVEATVFVAGVALGGTIGFGTIWFLVSIGPLVAVALRFLEIPAAHGERRLSAR